MHYLKANKYPDISTSNQDFIFKFLNINFCILWLYITDSGDLLLASCAQDCFVRVWRVSPTVDCVIGTQTDGDEIKLKQKLFHVSQRGIY